MSESLTGSTLPKPPGPDDPSDRRVWVSLRSGYALPPGNPNASTNEHHWLNYCNLLLQFAKKICRNIPLFSVVRILEDGITK